MLDRKIEYFIEVVEKGSFSSAARSFLLSQSAVSQQITLLENELNIQLFDRTGYKPQLTSAGKIFYEGCIKLKEESEELLRTIHEEHQKITIGLTQLQQNNSIIHIINKFKYNHPNVEFDLVEGTFEETYTNLSIEKTDVAFGLESDFKHDPYIHYTSLFQYQRGVICSLNHPFSRKKYITIDELKNESFIVMSKKVGRIFYKDFLNACKQDGYKPHIVKEVDSFEDFIVQVSLGKGIGICSMDVNNNALVKAIPISKTHHHNDCVIAYKDNVSSICQQFIDEAIHYFKTL